MKAIKDVGGELVAALDPHDSVGILDSYFPDCHFFTEFERFDRHCSLRKDIDYVSVCSPNYLHDSHARFAMRIGADAIVEKPLVLHPKNLDELVKVEHETGKRVNTILQLRHHREVIDAFDYCQTVKKENVRIKYNAPRGRWYDYSWKADPVKSGGLIFNIGVHLIDLCTYLWGDLKTVVWVSGDSKYTTGRFVLARADVYFTLDIEMGMKPQRTFRIGSDEIDFTKGFTDLHTTSYKEIINGNGWGIRDAWQATEICHQLRKGVS
jgi:UDP-N-acetyl-2-amino-2-deoxyglucuronate dehydrogenase